MTKISSSIQHNSGIPLGAIGAGSVEIRPDGLFHEWQIANCDKWNPGSPACGQVTQVPPEDLLFILRVHHNGKTTLRYLCLSTTVNNLFSIPWVRCVEAIHYDADFPLARLKYEDRTLPVDIEARVYSPFVPLDVDTSATPGFYIDFSVTNKTDDKMDVSILGVMQNPASYDSGLSCVNTASCDENTVSIVMGSGPEKTTSSVSGDTTFSVAGSNITYITGTYKEELRPLIFYTSSPSHKDISFLPHFRDHGCLITSNVRTAPSVARDLGTSTEKDRELLQELSEHSFIRNKTSLLEMADPSVTDTPSYLEDIANNIREINERNLKWGTCALCSSFTLSARETEEVPFTLSWYYPNHISPKNTNLGHYYENLFADSLEANTFLRNNRERIYTSVMDFVASFTSSSLPGVASDAILGQLTTMIKSTWFTRSGDFGVWEGLGCCGFHTTDITYQGSFPIISLFPELQKKQMLMGSRFQREDGRVHHLFTPDFSSVDDDYERIDMNPQFIALCARDFQWTGDKDYLRALWPHIEKAVESMLALDTDGDGLPDTNTRRNTYDVWDFQGIPSYIASLWHSGLYAASYLANTLSKDKKAEEYTSILKKSIASFEEKLFNGRYFVLWKDGELVDECCMSDQLSGEWFGACCGWPGFVERRKTELAIESVMETNFKSGYGLANALYPTKTVRRPATNGNRQAEAPWTGIEYTIASLLIYLGKDDLALDIIEDIHDRYMRAGLAFNHVECGWHYYRAMSSWTLLLAYSGFTWDACSGTMGFRAEDNTTFPFFTPSSWGTVSCNHSPENICVKIVVQSGSMGLGGLALPPHMDISGAAVLHNDRKVAATVEKDTGTACTFVDGTIKLEKSDTLIVTLN